MNEDVTPLRAMVKAFEPVLETVINPRGPVEEIPFRGWLLIAPVIPVGVALMVNDEIVNELV